MTTSSNPPTTYAEPSPSDYAEIWRAIGRLEGTATALLQGQQELRADLDTGLREVNRRIDRLFYAILGVGGALLVAMFAGKDKV